MTDKQLMDIARNLLNIKVMSETAAESLMEVGGEYGGLADRIAKDIDIVSASAARIALTLEETHPEFLEVMKRSGEASVARANMLAQKGDA